MVNESVDGIQDSCPKMSKVVIMNEDVDNDTDTCKLKSLDGEWIGGRRSRFLPRNVLS